MKPTKAGKINVNVQPCTLPIVSRSTKEAALTIQQTMPLVLGCLTANRNLSRIEPTIASTLPKSRAGRKICERITNSKSWVFSKLCCSSRA